MRRKDKEITDEAQIRGILERGKVCRVAFFDEEYPYMVPLCFGFDGKALYFHGFNGGKKIDCLHKNPKVCFEVDEDIEVVQDPDPCEWTMKYRSVVGFGTAVFLEETEEKREGLNFTLSVRIEPLSGLRKIMFWPSSTLARGTCIISSPLSDGTIIVTVMSAFFERVNPAQG